MCKQIEYTFSAHFLPELKVMVVMRARNYKEAHRKLLKYIYLNKIGLFEKPLIHDKCDYYFYEERT